MSENKYRKETKHWCELCRVFIQNNKIQLKSHDTSQQHRNATARSLKSIHRAQDMKVINAEKNKREMDKINAKAMLAMGLAPPITFSSKKAPEVAKKGSIDPSLYGIEGGYQDFDGSEFTATEAFLEANYKPILVAKIGEWVKCEEEVITKPILPHIEKREYEDEEEGVTKYDVDQFVIVEKNLHVREEHDDQVEELTFKKRKMNSTRKKNIDMKAV